MWNSTFSLLLLVTACAVLKCTGNISTGLTLTTHVGDTAFIPCSVPLASSLTIVWEINGVTYNIDSLQSRNLVRISSGLLINDVSDNNDGEYTCYSHDTMANNLQQLYVVHLTVLPSKETTNLPLGSNLFSVEDLRIDKGLNFQATENDIVFLPCVPALGTRNISIWTINSVIYPSERLPHGHLHWYGGILVDPVTLGTTGRVYECYSPVDNSIGVQYSIYLSIQPSNSQEYITTVFRQSSVFGGINLVSQKVNFNKTHKNFGFKLDTESTLESWEPLFTTEIIRLDEPGVILWDRISVDFEPIFSIPNKYFENNEAYATTFVKNLTEGNNEPFATLHYLYRANVNETVNENCIPEGNTQCVNLPTSKVYLSIIWPTHPHSDEDCSCPVFEERINGPKFNNCYCLYHNLTSYTVELQDNDRICFKNLNRSSNDTKILLVKDISLTFETLRTFESLTRITVEGPSIPPPVLFYSNSSNSLCVESNSTMWSPIKGAHVLVDDITGGSILNRFFLAANFCIDFNLLPKSCAPFYVNVTAFSQCVQSEPSSFQEIGNGNECECLKEKVSITLNIMDATSDEIVVTLNSSCSKYYDTGLESNILLTATEVSDCSTCKNASIPIAIICSLLEPSNHTIKGVSPSTQYKVTAEWVSPNTKKHCLLGDSQHIKTKEKLQLEVILPASIGGGLVILILLTCIIIIVVVCIRRLRRCNNKRYYIQNE